MRETWRVPAIFPGDRDDSSTKGVPLGSGDRLPQSGQVNHVGRGKSSLDRTIVFLDVFLESWGQSSQSLTCSQFITSHRWGLCDRD